MRDWEEDLGSPEPPFKDAENAPSRRLPYSAPRLEALGDIRELTLGGTPGSGDSVNLTTNPPIP